MEQLVEKIVSGGQTGVDRAALDVALRLGVPCGGWCPAGRLAEDGRISAAYPLEETPTGEYAERTEWNVRDSDGTLILARGELVGGTALTIVYAKQYGKPYCVVDFESALSVGEVAEWIRRHAIRILNVAGPRTSAVPTIYRDAATFLETLLSQGR